MFVEKKAKSNISKFQKGLLDSLHNDDHHIVAFADKGLGPVWVETPRYIKYTLVHLSNPETYQNISEAQGRQDSFALKGKIFEWTIQHHNALGKQEVVFIRKKLDKAMEEPYD